VDCVLLLDDLALLAGLAGLLVLGAHPNALYNNHAKFGHYLGNLAAFALVVARQDYYGVTFFYV